MTITLLLVLTLAPSKPRRSESKRKLMKLTWRKQLLEAQRIRKISKSKPRSQLLLLPSLK
jgi:hypothetical protein